MRSIRLAGALVLFIVPTLLRSQTIAGDSAKPSDNHVEGKATGRVTGIGGVFFTAQDPKALRTWYSKHLGIDLEPWGGKPFRWVDDAGNPTGGTTVWHIGTGRNFAPSTASFMINYRVSDLDALLATLRAEGCQVVGEPQDSEDGKFGWVMDPEGNKIELWQPPEGR